MPVTLKAELGRRADVVRRIVERRAAPGHAIHVHVAEGRTPNAVRRRDTDRVRAAGVHTVLAALPRRPALGSAVVRRCADGPRLVGELRAAARDAVASVRAVRRARADGGCIRAVNTGSPVATRLIVSRAVAVGLGAHGGGLAALPSIRGGHPARSFASVTASSLSAPGVGPAVGRYSGSSAGL